MRKHIQMLSLCANFFKCISAKCSFSFCFSAAPSLRFRYRYVAAAAVAFIYLSITLHKLSEYAFVVFFLMYVFIRSDTVVTVGGRCRRPGVRCVFNNNLKIL